MRHGFPLLPVQQFRHCPVPVFAFLPKLSMSVLCEIGDRFPRPPLCTPAAGFLPVFHHRNIVIPYHLAQVLLVYLVIYRQHFLRRNNTVTERPLLVIVNMQVFHALVCRANDPARQHPVERLVRQSL